MQSSTFVCSAKSEVGVAMDCPTTSAAVKPDFQVMSAQAEASADAPLQNGVDAGTSRVREEEAETGARGSGPVLSTGSEPGQEASRGGGQSGEGADMAQAWPAAPTWNGEDDRSREGCVDDRAPGVVEQGPETRADITGQAGTSGGGPAVDSGMLGGAPLSNQEMVHQSETTIHLDRRGHLDLVVVL